MPEDLKTTDAACPHCGGPDDHRGTAVADPGRREWAACIGRYGDFVHSPPKCPTCGEDVLYELQADALDGENLDNGFRLAVFAWCETCKDKVAPDDRMKNDLMRLAGMVVPDGAEVKTGWSEG